MTRTISLNTMVLLILLSFLAACGELWKQSDTPGKVRRELSVPTPPSQDYFVEDEDCQLSRDPVTLTETFLTHLNSFGLATRRFGLLMTETRKSLQSHSVRQVIWGRRHIRECDQRHWLGSQCRDRRGHELPWLHSPSDRKLLRVCRDGYQYDRASLEAMALSVIQKLNTARKQATLAYSQIKLPHIDVELVPNFIDRHTYVMNQDGAFVDEDHYQVDNMAYFPGSKMIAVFPESITRASQSSRLLHFWESEFVIFHEFGHHVQAMLLTDIDWSDTMDWNPLKHKFQSSKPQLHGSDDNYRRAQMWSVVAEGFADSFALYAANESKEAFWGLESDLSIGRNPSQEYFADGVTKKRLERSTVEVLIGVETGFPDLQFRDPHRVGAALAFSLNHIFDEFLSGNGESESLGPPGTLADRGAGEQAQVKMQLLLKWLVAFARNDKVAPSRAMDAPGLFAPITKSLEEILTDYAARNFPELPTQSWRKRVCVATQKYMPVLARYPYADPGTQDCLVR